MALPDYIGPVPGTARTTGISSASVASGANYLGSAIDNATNLDSIADVEWIWQFATAPTSNKTMKLFVLYSHDGSNFEEGAGDGSGSGDVDPLPHCLVRAVSPPADTNTHRLFCTLPVEPYKFKLLVQNTDTGQTATVSVNLKTRKEAQITE